MPPMRRLPCLVAWLVLCALGAAQEPGEDEPQAELGGWSLRPFVVGRASARADLDQLEGRLGLWRAGAGVAATRPLSPELTLGIGTSYEASTYEFSSSTFTGGESDPFDDPWRASVWTSLAKHRPEDRVDWSGGLFANVGAEDGAALEDALTYGFTVRLAYDYSERLTVIGGLVGTTRLEDSFLVFPIGGIDYRFDERFSVGSQGEGVGATYAFAQNLRTYFNVAFGVRQFRLDDEGLLPEGVLRDDETAATLGLVWSPSRSFTAELFGGYAWREVTFLDGAGGGFADDVDPAPFIGLRLAYGLL